MIKAVKKFFSNKKNKENNINKNQKVKSLRMQIFVIILIIGILACIMSRHGLLRLVQSMAVDTKIERISSQLIIISNHISSYPYEKIDNATGEMLSDAEFLESRLLLVDRAYRVEVDSYNVLAGHYLVNEAVNRGLRGECYSEINDKKGYIEFAVPVVIGSTEDYVLYAISSIQGTQEDLNHLRLSSMVFLLIIGLGITGVAYLIASIISSNISQLAHTIENVAAFEEGDIESVGYRETEGIIRAFNAQRTRLKALDDSRQEFVSNVSHELKTPIASIKVLAESLIFQENAPIEMYRDFMQDIVEEIDRENSIITDLLALVHMEQGKENLNVTEVDCNSMIELIIKRLTPIAKQNDIDIFFESDGQVFASMDEVKMTLAITNLVENAIKYNQHPGWVKVFMESDGQTVTITISDSGIGISDEALPHIFERFYRVDKSHSKEIGGTGLGLPLARKIVLLHRGSITVESQIGEGTDFIVRIPLDYV